MTIHVNKPSANNNLLPDVRSVQSGSSASTNVPMVDKKKQDILNKFGIDIDTYNKILSSNPNFLKLDPASQREIVDSYRNPKPQTQYKEFDPQTYNSSTVDQKRQTRNYEFAKNIYVYGYKGDGKHTQTIPAHSEETWNNISEEERAEFVDQVVNKAKDILNNDQNLKNVYATFSNSDRKISDEEMVNIGMEALEVANANNMSIQDFMRLRDSKRMDLIYNHLKSQQYDNLTESQLKRLEFYGNMKDQVAEYIKDKFETELPKDASISQVYRIANDYNLSQEKAEYEILQKKKSRTEFEDNRYQELKDLFETPAGKDVIDKTQAAKLLRLQHKYNELLNKKQSGQELSPEEEEQLKRLEYTMNTEESKRLFEVAKYLPKPQTEREKQIYEEWRQLNEDISTHGNDSKIRLATQIAWIEAKSANLPEDEREAYITDILKFNNGPSSIGLLQHFRKVYPSLLEKKFLISENALNTDNMNSQEYKIYTDARNECAAEAKKNGDKHTAGVIYNASITSNEILKSPRCAGPEHDDKKVINASANSVLADYYEEPQSTEILNSTTDVNVTITNAEKQLEAQQYIQNSSAYNEDVAKHEIDVLDQFHEDNRETIRNTATSYSQEVADYAIQKDSDRTNNTSSNNSSTSANNTANTNNTFEETLRNLDISKSEDVQQLLNLVRRNPVEVTKYLNSCSGQERNAFIEKYCNVADKSQILAFIKQNRSLYGIVLKYAHNLDGIAVFNAVYNGNKSEIPELVQKIGLVPEELADSRKDLASDIAITMENSELARNILLNPAQWGYNLGSSDNDELNQIASKEQIKDATKSAPDTSPKTARTLMKEFDPMYLGKDGVVWA